MRELEDQEAKIQMEKADLEAMEAMMNNIDSMSPFDTRTYEPWEFEYCNTDKDSKVGNLQDPASEVQEENVRSRFPTCMGTSSRQY